MRGVLVIRSMLVALVGAGLACLLCVTRVDAATIVVNTTADELNTGPSCSLREAIQSANTDSAFGGCTTGNGDDVITLPAGLYRLGRAGVDDTNVNGDLDISSNITLNGAGATSTIIDGSGSFTGDRVIQITGAVSVSLARLTIRNGRSTSQGGGIFVTGAALTISDSAITGNTTTSYGGGISVQGPATLDIRNSTISRNTASSDGAGIEVDTGTTLTISNSDIIDNSANSTGAGIAAFGPASIATITNSTISRNSTTSVAGGIRFSQTNATITSSTIDHNTADGPGATGAGILTDGPLTITNSTISNNSATSPSGVGGALVLTGSAVGPINVIHTTISGNSAGFGGGIGNPSASATVDVRATVLDAGPAGQNCVGAIASHGGNLSSDTSCQAAFNQSGDQNNVNLHLGPLANNGGPTESQTLLDGSPAIDAVQGSCTSDGTAGGTAITTDQRGLSRPQGLRCDAGAVERQGGTLQFGSPGYSVAEAGGNASITVIRTGGNEGTVGATVSSADGSATAPADYTAVSNAVSFPNGDTAPKTVPVPIVSDAVSEPSETVNLSLSSPTGGASLGAQSTAALTILDDDVPTPTPTATPIPTATLAPTATPAPVMLHVTRAGPDRLQVEVSVPNVVQTISWAPSPAFSIEDANGAPVGGSVLTLPPGSVRAVFYLRRLSAGAVTVPLTLSGPFGTWQTFVGGGPDAWL